MISIRWLALVTLAAVMTVSSAVTAAPTMTPNPLDVGTVAVGSSGSVDGLLSNPGATFSELADIVVDPTCAHAGEFTFMPNTNIVIPPQFMPGTGVNIKAGFAPTTRGTVSCRVDIIAKQVIPGTTSFVVTGTGQAPELSVTTSSPVDFGSIRVANAATLTSTRTVIVRNTGELPLTISSLTMSGADPGDYTVMSPSMLPQTVAPNTNLSVIVVFNPSSSGTQTANLEIKGNDPIEDTEVVALTGIGTNALIDVTDVDFATVDTGDTSPAQTITISNTASAPVGTLTLGTATITQASTWFSFAASNGCAAGATTCTPTANTLPPNRTVTVRCHPPANGTGTQTATVSFASDTDGGGDNQSTLTCEAGRADVSPDVTALNFGDVLVGDTSAPQTVTLTNNGNVNLSFTLAKGGTNPGMFSVSPACSTACVVNPGADAVLTVTMAPSSVGAKSATIVVTSNDPDNGTLTITLAGTGVSPTASVDPTSLAFGTVEVGTQSAGQSVTVTNTGTSDLSITAAALTAGAADYNILAGPTPTAGSPTVLGPSESVAWTLACEPTTFGNRPGNFRITSNSSAGAQINVGLTCSGHQLTISPATFDFGGVRQGEIETHNFTLTNNGNVAVSNITAMLSNTTAGYSVTAPAFPASLAAGASTTVTVRFAPADGNAGGTIQITFAGTWGSAIATSTEVTISGDGLTTGFDVTPSAIDFGELRFDTTLSRTFCIVNTDESALTISALSITPDVGTMSNELSVPPGGVVRKAVCGVGTGTNAPLPQSLAAGQLLEVTVIANPANRVGVMGATVTVTSDLAMNPTRTVDLAAVSTTAMLSTTVDDVPMITVEFGAVDIDTGPITKTIRIINTGEGPLDLTGFARTTGPAFTLALPSNQTVPSGGMVTIPVTYTPTMERAAGQEEQIILSHNIAGILGGPAMQMITISGRGIDRHIALGPTPVFPDTFRNPGDAAPMRPVMITNTGEATLRISAVMVSNSDIWELVDPNPVDVPGGATHTFNVRFHPKMAGVAPTGELVIMNDDNTTSDTPMAMVLLNGNGIDRNVTISDPVIDVGYSGIGIPLTVPDILAVTSMDPNNGFRIRAIQLADGSVFSIPGSPMDLDLAPATTARFAITFTPTLEGDFETKALLFLDMDPEPQAEVTIRGHGVFVDAHGSGGCASTGDASGGALVLLGVLWAMRRRRRMTGVVAAIVAIFVTTGVGVHSAHAQSSRNLDLSLFNPAPSTAGNGFQVQPAEVGTNGAWIANALFSYSTNPLVLSYGDQPPHLAITRRTTIELGGAYAFLNRFEAGARLPMYVQEGDDTMVGVPPPSGTSRGDLTLHGKARLLTAARISLGVGLHATLPTATDGKFAGVNFPTARLLGLMTVVPTKRFWLSVNAGAVARKDAEFANIEQGSGFTGGAGVSLRLFDSVVVTGEAFGEVIPFGKRMRPATGNSRGKLATLTMFEFLVGAQFQLERRISLGLAGGRGLNTGLGTPEVRGIAVLSFTPAATDLANTNYPGYGVDDTDGDGLLNSVDKCPKESEDNDQFDDYDGCPDPDNDKDFFADDQDKCPNDREDVDGYQDDDGCPEPDNDEDGVVDLKDKCPLSAEDKDGFEDLDGCPEVDNDLDGILDLTDRCPIEAETINGVQDDDGCPDNGDSMVILTPSGLETLDTIQFTRDKLSPRSFNVLGQVGATLRAHTEILRLKIIAHVQPTGNAKRDQELSEKRADAIRDWLIGYGVSATRLSSAGAGGSKPLVPAKQKGSAMLNDRIELVILERK
ncbi:MAG: choice-of-anchor D domain-containing protein [Kofleriaceae bacterium]